MYEKALYENLERFKNPVAIAILSLYILLLEKEEQALLVKLFYTKSSNLSAGQALKKIISKFEVTGQFSLLQEIDGNGF